MSDGYFLVSKCNGFIQTSYTIPVEESRNHLFNSIKGFKRKGMDCDSIVRFFGKVNNPRINDFIKVLAFR